MTLGPGLPALLQPLWSACSGRLGGRIEAKQLTEVLEQTAVDGGLRDVGVIRALETPQMKRGESPQ